VRRHSEVDQKILTAEVAEKSRAEFGEKIRLSQYLRNHDFGGVGGVQ
jgi:hypothetical protein